MPEHRRSSWLTRNFAFAPKEMREAARQPRMIITLVLGPFLILFLFGLGYRPVPGPLETLLVTPPEGRFATETERLSDLLGENVDLRVAEVGEDEAIRQLASGEVDLVVVAPEDAAERVRAGEHAVIEIVHDRLDPFDRAYIQVLAQTSTDHINRIVLEEAARQVQEEAAGTAEPLPEARQSATQMVEAIERDDDAAARTHHQALVLRLSLLAAALASSADLVEGVESGVGGEAEEGPVEALEAARTAAMDLDPTEPGALEDARALEDSLSSLETQIIEFRQLEPSVLVQPFTTETRMLTQVDLGLESFYVPGVIAVLLQHIAVTFGALSLVRDRRMGIVEVFRVSPLSTGEMMVGKYLAYTVYGIVIAALLVLLSVVASGVPMLGEWWMLGVVLLLTILASLALGFLLSALSVTNTQAVQYAMIVLLVTIFFSGFVISLERLHPAATVVSNLIPATMAIRGMQDIMFRGALQEPTALMVLIAYFLVAAVAGWWLVRKQMHEGV